MSPSAWLLVHLVAVAVLSGVGWVVQAVVYPAFRLVGPDDWGRYHARHLRAITPVVTVPWLAQGVSTVALLVAPAAGGRPAVGVLAALAVVAVAATVTAALPAHERLSSALDAPAVAALLRANLVRTLAWTASTALAATLLPKG